MSHRQSPTHSSDLRLVKSISLAITVLANENGICMFQLLWFLNAQIIVAQRLLYSYNEIQETLMNRSSKPPWPWLLNKSDLRHLWLYHRRVAFGKESLGCYSVRLVWLPKLECVCVDKKLIINQSINKNNNKKKTVKIKNLNKTLDKSFNFCLPACHVTSNQH